MTAFTLTNAPMVRNFGRSGYNKDETEESSTRGNQGRSGYNGPQGDDDSEADNSRCTSLGGGSGYNLRGDDDENQDSGRSGYN